MIFWESTLFIHEFSVRIYVYSIDRIRWKRRRLAYSHLLHTSHHVWLLNHLKLWVLHVHLFCIMCYYKSMFECFLLYLHYSFRPCTCSHICALCLRSFQVSLVLMVSLIGLTKMLNHKVLCNHHFFIKPILLFSQNLCLLHIRKSY